MPVRRAVALSASWGVGAAIGMALGSVITALSGAGAPGASAVEPVADLVVIPLLAGAAVFVVHLAVSLLIARSRARGAPEDEAKADESRED